MFYLLCTTYFLTKNRDPKSQFQLENHNSVSRFQFRNSVCIKLCVTAQGITLPTLKKGTKIRKIKEGLLDKSKRYWSQGKKPPWNGHVASTQKKNVGITLAPLKSSKGQPLEQDSFFLSFFLSFNACFNSPPPWSKVVVLLPFCHFGWARVKILLG